MLCIFVRSAKTKYSVVKNKSARSIKKRGVEFLVVRRSRICRAGPECRGGYETTKEGGGRRNGAGIKITSSFAVLPLVFAL